MLDTKLMIVSVVRDRYVSDPVNVIKVIQDCAELELARLQLYLMQLVLYKWNRLDWLRETNILLGQLYLSTV